MLQVGLNETNFLFVSPCLNEIFDALFIDGEKRASGPVLGTHIGDRRAVGDGQMGNAGAEEFHEFADYTLGAKML